MPLCPMASRTENLRFKSGLSPLNFTKYLSEIIFEIYYEFYGKGKGYNKTYKNVKII